MNSEIIGWAGSVIILISFIPKKVRMIRLFNSIGCLVWIFYGIITGASSIYIMNSLIFVLNVIQLIKMWKNNWC